MSAANAPFANAPPWLWRAYHYIGTAEIPGPRHNPLIQRWLVALRAWWDDDETPWCGTFVAACLQASGISLPQHWYRARAWLDWGAPLAAPALGALAVFERGPHQGHVGFVAGRHPAGWLMILGGNQGNRVSVAPFAPERLLGYRWPAGEPLRELYTALPAIDSSAALSINEA